MGGKDVSKKINIVDSENLVALANFAVAKALVRLNVFESEIKILNEHLRDLGKAMKIKKITHFINKQS